MFAIDGKVIASPDRDRVLCILVSLSDFFFLELQISKFDSVFGKQYKLPKPEV